MDELNISKLLSVKTAYWIRTEIYSTGIDVPEGSLWPIPEGESIIVPGEVYGEGEVYIEGELYVI